MIPAREGEGVTSSDARMTIGTSQPGLQIELFEEQPSRETCMGYEAADFQGSTVEDDHSTIQPSRQSV